MKPHHGLVIGKFYPPHAGHHLLVKVASAMSERVSVVMAAREEVVSLADRVDWMREVHVEDRNVFVAGVRDDHPVDYASDALWRAHVDLMIEGARGLTPERIDAVFTSEEYGDELGRRLGARHVCVDRARELVPASGTSVRADIARAWDLLAPAVRGGLARRVVIVGAESTGKTTLAAALADRLRQRGGSYGLCRWVPEYGREFTLLLWAHQRARAQLENLPAPKLEELTWESTHFTGVAEEQNRREDAASRQGGPVVICDTDAFATGIWHERYAGHRSQEVEDLARVHPLYLLTHHDDVPFTQDGVRDGEHVRSWMTDRFAERLTQTGRRWAWVRGNPEARLEASLAEIDRLGTALRPV